MAVALIILCAALILAGAIVYSSKLVAEQIMGDVPLQIAKRAKADQQPQAGISVVEMSPQKFKELPYRKRMTPAEAAIYYEKKNEERMREEMKKLG